jgi:hypothetical protein
MAYYELIDVVEVIINPMISVIIRKGERFKGGTSEKGTILCIGLNGDDFCGMKVEGGTFLTVIVPNEKVKEISSPNSLSGLFEKI